MGFSVVAAATEYDDNSEDYNPGTVVVKDVTKAVVVHYVSSEVELSLGSLLFYARIRNW